MTHLPVCVCVCVWCDIIHRPLQLELCAHACVSIAFFTFHWSHMVAHVCKLGVMTKWLVRTSRRMMAMMAAVMIRFRRRFRRRVHSFRGSPVTQRRGRRIRRSSKVVTFNRHRRINLHFHTDPEKVWEKFWVFFEQEEKTERKK